MPLFQILGSSRSNRGGSSTGNQNVTSSSSNPAASAPPPPQQQQQQRTSRHTYPGHRISSASSSSTTPDPPAGQQLPPHTASTYHNNSATAPRYAGGYPQQQQQQQPSGAANPNAQSNMVIRGSNLGASAPPASQPPSSAPGASASGARPGPTAPPNTPSVETSRPGAYSVTRTQAGPSQVYRVMVPAGVRPGSEFTVHAGARRVRVRCPPTSRPGHSLQITLPPEPITHNQMLHMAPLTASIDNPGGGGAVPMTPQVRKVNQAATESGGTAQTFLVTIPPNIYPGMQFTVHVNEQRFMVTCPSNAGPNMKVRIVPPTQREEPLAAPKTQVFEVMVPAGVRPNQPFTLMANGQRVLVTCPPNVVPGQKIRFQLPVQQVIGSIQLSYESESGGWCRTIRVNDLKFQWVRVNKNEKSGKGADSTAGSSTTNAVDVDGMQTFDFSKSAYVRKLTFLEGNDARMRTGTVELVPANEAVVDSRLVEKNRTLVSYADIATAQGKPLEEKTNWFQNICTQLTQNWDDGHIKIVVRRRSLLNDSVDAIMSLGRDDMRKRWRMEFLGEPGIDAGGVTREWFQLVTEQLFDPDFGLWLSSVNNQACMTINPASNISCPDDHLVHFRFLGRVLGRALFDRQLVKGHMVRHIYKHLLGWPITFEDLDSQDEEYYQALKKLTTMEDISMMCLDFTVTEETLGVRQDVELVEGGNAKEVTKENLPQYLEANLRYRMMNRIKPQLTELMLGFFDVVPEPPLTVFDPNELELILCGLPSIDMDDWERNTIYSGLYESKGKRHQVVEWFWQVVRDDLDQEMKARLLQFVTGTSGVPTRGFSVLQGNDGNIKKFAVHGVDVKSYLYPRAHTCFNRIDLPNYTSKKDLLEKLRAAITLSSVGFDME